METLGVQTNVDDHGHTRETHSKFMVLSYRKGSKKDIGIYNNMLSPYEFVLYNSSADDNLLFKFYFDVKKIGDIEQTISYIADGHHKNDKELAAYLVENNALELAEKECPDCFSKK